MPSRLLVAIALLLVGTGCGHRSAVGAGDGGHDSAAAAAADAGTLPRPEGTPQTHPCPLCPETPPTPTGACSVNGQLCTFGSSSCQSAWRCDAGRWQLIADCVASSVCPATAPVDGSACTAALRGQDCFYSPPCCTAAAIAQCDGNSWRHVNGCPGRDLVDTCPLVPTLPSPLAAMHPAKQVDHPALALAGTQLLLAVTASAGMIGGEGIHVTRVQTAPAAAPAPFVPELDRPDGRDPGSSPVLAWDGARFLLAWHATDGWPVTVNHQPGVFVQGVPRQDGWPELLVDDRGSSATDLVMSSSARWLTYRHASPSNPAKSAASIVALGPEGQPIGGTRNILADEGAEVPWFAEPPPVALAQVEPWEGGAVVAAPAIAAGDEWDDSGIRLHFLDAGATTFSPSREVRLAVGFPKHLALAALGDGSVVVAYVPASLPPGPVSFAMARVSKEGAITKLTAPSIDGSLNSGPALAPFEQGFAVAWSSASSGKVHVQIYGPAGTVASQANFETQVPGLSAHDRLALVFGQTDRSLHLAWSAQDAQGLSRVHRQRLICGSGPTSK